MHVTAAMKNIRKSCKRVIRVICEMHFTKAIDNGKPEEARGKKENLLSSERTIELRQSEAVTT